LFTMKHLIMITRRFRPNMPVTLSSAEEIDQLATCLGQLGENSAGLADFLDACHAVRGIKLGDPHRLAMFLLKVAMSRPKEVLAEVLYSISRWPDLRSPTLSAQMRNSYGAVIRQEVSGAGWAIREPLFSVYHVLYRLKNLFIRPGYSQPFDLVGYAFGSLMRRFLRW
jgi:hypothetical protein